MGVMGELKSRELVKALERGREGKTVWVKKVVHVKAHS